MKIKIINCDQCGKRVLEITTKNKRRTRIDYKCRHCGIDSTRFLWYEKDETQ